MPHILQEAVDQVLVSFRNVQAGQSQGPQLERPERRVAAGAGPGAAARLGRFVCSGCAFSFLVLVDILELDKA